MTSKIKVVNVERCDIIFFKGAQPVPTTTYVVNDPQLPIDIFFDYEYACDLD